MMHSTSKSPLPVPTTQTDVPLIVVVPYNARKLLKLKVESSENIAEEIKWMMKGRNKCGKYGIV